MNISYSVIIPAYNEQAYLPATLDALQHAMSRCGMAGEVIVVNNNSHDQTADVAAEMGATVVFEPINQISRARNTGARAAKGRYLIFLDADTLISPEILNTALGNLSSGSCCGGGGRVMFQGDLTGFARYGAKFWNWISSRFRLAAGCFIYCLKEGFDAVGGFSQSVYASEEIWFSRQMQAWGRQQGMDFRIIINPPLVTSDRKLQWFSPIQLITFAIVFFIFPFAVRFRPLCAFWYARSAPRRGTDKNNKRFDGIASDCHSCIINQAHTAARFAELDEDQTMRVITVAREWMEKSGTMPVLVQHVIRYVADAVIQERGESPYFDIYADVKEQSNTLSLNYAKRLENQINQSALPLETGLQIAAAGNIIDFGAKSHGAIDLDKELQSLATVPFARYDIVPFKKVIDGASTLLYICDNCGEIVFDMLFIKTLQRLYPDIHIVAALRDKPIINDATLEDAKSVGMDRLVTTISSGSIYPGTILPETTETFQKLFTSADVILSKGQGNFETLLPVADQRIFFLLRIKCDYMAALSKVKKANLVLMQGERLKTEG